MSRRLALLATVLCAAPLPALAQAWPAGAVVSMASVRAPDPRVRAFIVTNLTPAAATPPVQSAPIPPLKVKARSALDADDPPAVDVRAKAEWSDDQGFRATPTKVSYKLLRRTCRPL